MKAYQFGPGENVTSVEPPANSHDRVAHLESIVRELRSDLARLARLCPPGAGLKCSDALYEIYRRNLSETGSGCPRGT